MAALAWIGPVASASAGDPAGRGEADRLQAERLCAEVVGLPSGGTHFAACAQSLSASLRDLQRTSALSQARAACLRDGVAAADLPACELQRADAEPTPAPQRRPERPGGAASYFAVSPAVGWRREQLACAELGFDPSQDAFGVCAANLQAALSRQSTP